MPPCKIMKQCKIQTLVIIYWWPCTSNDGCELYSGSECHHFSRRRNLLPSAVTYRRNDYNQIIHQTVVANFSHQFKKGV